MRMKKIICLMLAGSCILSACSRTAESESETSAVDTTQEENQVLSLSVATVGNWEGIVRGKVFDEYAEKLSEWSDGTMEIKLYDAGSLGDDKDLIEGVKLGTLNIINSCPAYQTDVVPEAALLDAPGLYTSIEQYNIMMESGYMDVMQQYYNDAGLQLLGSFAYTFRQMSSNKPTQTLADLQGLRIRTMENRYHEIYWQAMGATSIPLVFSELYMALSQGTMDAQENSIYNLVSSNLGEVQRYVIFTYHAPMVSSYVMNKEQYDALTEEQQDLLHRMIDGIKADVIANIPEEEEQNQKELSEKYGMAMLYPNTEMVMALREGSGRDAVIAALREDLGNEKVDTFLQVLEDATRKAGEH